MIALVNGISQGLTIGVQNKQTQIKLSVFNLKDVISYHHTNHYVSNCSKGQHESTFVASVVRDTILTKD